MPQERLADAIPDGEALRYTDDLRTGGNVGFTDERLLVAREGEDSVTSVELQAVDSVEFHDLDWFNGALGLLLLAFGLFSLPRNYLLGGGFVLAALGSLYLTYRKRTKVVVKLHERPKPLTVYPANGNDFYGAFEEALDTYRERFEDPPRGPVD